MKTAVNGLELIVPRSVDEALGVLHDRPDVAPIAGGTDLFVMLNFGQPAPRAYMDVTRLRELRHIEKQDGGIVIGALATHTDIARSALVRERLPMLAAAAREIGGIQIQNRGTLGGNVANGSPAGDTLPVLAVADATVVLRDARGERRVPFAHYYTGYRASVRRPEELIVAFEVPQVEGAQWFRKVGTRAAQAISKIVMAGVRSASPRIALGSVAPTVIRLSKTEEALASGATIDAAKLVLRSEIQPIDDIRSTAAYRWQVSQNLLGRFWADTATA
jgi:xanthine dehydrogenase small subunit